ncbi:MAG: hypothetical protein ACN6OP_16910, partial [Pseudomonadales bacterium]
GDEKTPSGVSTSTPPVPANLMTPPAPSNREVQRAPNLTLGPVEYRNSAAGVVVQPGITMSQVPMPTSSSTGRSIRVYSLEEITSMEQAKGYQGNDLIVRRRLTGRIEGPHPYLPREPLSWLMCPRTLSDSTVW